MRRLLSIAALVMSVVWGLSARAEGEAPLGYPEPVVHWLVGAGETCRDIVVTLYESESYEDLIRRYNDVDCSAPLEVDRLLVLPLEVRAIPVARLADSKPVVRARPPDGAWAVANTGMTFDEGYGVNTLAQASADLLFRDNSRILLQENTLVVIYDGSNKSVSRLQSGGTQVAVSEGELRAAIASLQGPPVLVTTDDGAGVQVRGRETTVARRVGRTAVSVFDGEARVTSSDTSVTVPKEHGTTYFDAAPPWRPRPLPAAPVWTHVGSRVAVHSGDTGEPISLAWSAVPSAVSYRIELARDLAFRRVVLREEVPIRVRSLALSAIPAGRYFVRVQAVDADGLLGIPTTPQAVWMLGLSGDVLRRSPDSMTCSAYETVTVESGDDLALSANGSPVDGTAPPQSAGIVDTAKDGVQALVWRSADGEEQNLRLLSERPRVQLVAFWLNTEKPTLRLQSRVSGRLWRGGSVEFGGLTAQQWDRAAFRWQVSQGGDVGYVLPSVRQGAFWVEDVRLTSAGAVEVGWVDRAGVELVRIRVPERVAPVEPVVPASWKPVGDILPDSVLPVMGVGAPGALAVGLRTAPGSRSERAFVVASARVSSVWSVATDWSVSVGSGLTKRDNGGIAAYAAVPLAEGWHLGVRSGVRLPFSLSDAALASTGLALQRDLDRWSVLGGADIRVPVSSSPGVGASANYQLGLAWRSGVIPLRAFVWGEGAQTLNRAPELLRGAGYLGLSFGSTWAAGLVVRAPTTADFGSRLTIQSSLQRHF